MPDRSRITVFILTPPIFRYHLPLKGLSHEMELVFDDMYS
jgi:hypothetical protein